MRNVCIVLRKKVSMIDVGTSVVLDTFFLSGYTFDEISVLTQEQEMLVRTRISELKQQAETILLLADKTALPVAKRYISDAFSESCLQNSFGAASVYQDKDSVLMLLSSDDSDTGSAFAKSVCIPFLQQKNSSISTKRNSFHPLTFRTFRCTL